MRATSILCALFTTRSVSALSLTYWTDPKCLNRPTSQRSLQPVIDQAISTAGKAWARLSSDADDEPYEWAMKTVMKVNSDDEGDYQLPGQTRTFKAAEWVGYVAQSISSLRQINDQDAANVRFMCDDDNYYHYLDTNDAYSWQLIPDDDDPDTLYKNSIAFPGQDQEFFDQQNWIRRNVKTLGCKDTHPTDADSRTMMEAFAMPMDDEMLEAFRQRSGGPRPPATIEPRRTRITVCDWTFDETYFPVRTFADIESREKVLETPLSSPFWESVVVMILLHELMHMYSLFLLDIDGEAAIRWDNAVDADMTPQEALSNADNHMFFHVLAVMLDHKIRLDTDPAKAQDGVLVHDDSLSKRAERQALMRWVRRARDFENTRSRDATNETVGPID